MTDRNIIPLVFVFIGSLILAILNAYFFLWLEREFFECQPIDHGLNEFPDSVKVLLLIVVAPIVETYLFLELPRTALLKVRITNKFVQLIFSSLTFSVAHFYCWIYVFMTFTGGVIMNIVYNNAMENKCSPFWTVSVFHALYNLYGFLFVV